MSYLGSKAASGAYQAIISIMPPHSTYIDTHLGSGMIMATKPPCQKNIGIDIDPNAISYAKANRLANYDHDLELHNQCAHTFLKDYNFNGDELIYCDPPYLLETRTSNKRYNYEYSKEQHINLINLLKNLNAKVILSGYPSKLYTQLLSDWNTKEFQVMTRGGVRTEKLWFNYELDSTYWSTFAGKDFTQRQQIKRKAQRWANNYKKMAPTEQLAVMAALLEVNRF